MWAIVVAMNGCCFRMNEFVSWSPSEFGGIQRLDFEQKYMWIPDVMFFNQLSGEHFNERFPAPPSVIFTGETLILKPFRVELECRLEVLHFPFDLHVSYVTLLFTLGNSVYRAYCLWRGVLV